MFRTIDNIQGLNRWVVYDQCGDMRPVVSMVDNVTVQAIDENNDILITYENYAIRAIHNGEPVGKDQMPVVGGDTLAFLKGERDDLPAGGNWDGVNTIIDLSRKYGLDRFFKDTHGDQVLAGLLDIVANPSKPLFSNINTDKLYKRPTKINKYPVKINRILGKIEDNYDAWLANKKPESNTPNMSWRNATRMPEYLSVSCIKNDNGTHRYNELIVYRENKEPEIINVFDLVNAFGFPDNNFIVLPYKIDEDVTRVAYILHNETKTKRNGTDIWLYRKR